MSPLLNFFFFFPSKVQWQDFNYGENCIFLYDRKTLNGERKFLKLIFVYFLYLWGGCKVMMEGTG